MDKVAKVSYLSLIVIVGFAVSLLGGSAYPTFLAIITVSHVVLSAASLRVSSFPSSATYVFAVAFLSYPFLFAVDRGNFELLVFVLLSGFLFFFTRGRHGWAALCLGPAIAL